MDNREISDKLKNNFHTWNSYGADEGIERSLGERGMRGSSRKDTSRDTERVIINNNFRRYKTLVVSKKSETKTRGFSW